MSLFDRLKRRPIMPEPRATVIDPDVVHKLDEVTSRLEDMVTRLAARLDEREDARVERGRVDDAAVAADRTTPPQQEDQQ